MWLFERGFVAVAGTIAADVPAYSEPLAMTRLDAIAPATVTAAARNGLPLYECETATQKIQRAQNFLKIFGLVVRRDPRHSRSASQVARPKYLQ